MHIHTPEHLQLTMQACGLSEAGDVRSHNEDRFVVDTALGLVAVADGMGGHMSGEIASTAALAALVGSLRQQPPACAASASDTASATASAGALDTTSDGESPSDPDATDVDQRWHSIAQLRRVVACVNTLLYQENCAHGHAEGNGMGSTLTGLRFLPGAGAVVSFHVGDSRLYRFRAGVLVQLTRDQTAYQLALESSAPGPLPPTNLLLQAIGPAPQVTPEFAYHQVLAGDLFLLCSDGLHGWVPHAQIDALLRRDDALGAACAGLLALARQYASRDNVTALLARFDGLARLEKSGVNRASDRARPA